MVYSFLYHAAWEGKMNAVVNWNQWHWQCQIVWKPYSGKCLLLLGSGWWSMQATASSSSGHSAESSSGAAKQNIDQQENVLKRVTVTKRYWQAHKFSCNGNAWKGSWSYAFQQEWREDIFFVDKDQVWFGSFQEVQQANMQILQVGLL